MTKLQVVLAIPVGVAAVYALANGAIWVHEMIRAGWL